MKRDSILIALAIGFIIFVIRSQIKNLSISFLFQLQLFSLSGIAMAMKIHFSKVKVIDPEFKITFGNAFWLGFRICLIAAFFSGLAYFIVPINAFQVYESSKFIRTLDIILSTTILGIILSAIYSWFIVYKNL